MKTYILEPSGADRAAYLNYLLERLTEFRKAGRGFGQKHAGNLNVHITRASIQKQLAWPLVDELHFEETCAHIKAKIDNTILGRNNAAKGRGSYHSFADHGKPKTISPQSRGDTEASNTSNEVVESAKDNERHSPSEDESIARYAMTCSNAASGVCPKDSSASLQLCGEKQSDGSEVKQQSRELVGSPTAYPSGSSPLSPIASSPSPTMKSLELGAWRARMLKSARPLLAADISQAKVATMIGTSPATLCRLIKDFADLTDDQLTPENCAADFTNSGRASEFDDLLKVPEIVTEMNRLYVATMGASCAQATRGRRTGSIALTLKRLGDSPLMPEHLAAKLRSGSQPVPLVSFLNKSWTPEVEAKLRGQKHYATATISGRRDLVEEMSDGTLAPLKPGRVWVLDDMSSNIPFWFEVDAGLKTQDSGLSDMIKRHRCAVGRQGLYCWDWASSAWLGLDLIGRLRDAYQASDILRFLRKLMMRYGKPDKIVIEQGVWKSRAISGWKVGGCAGDSAALIEVENGWQINEMLGDETAKITDGIRALGVEIIYAYTPRGKPIEGAFNYHQRIVPTFLQQGEAVNIGRHAGEFEWAAKQARRAADGVLHARDLGFIHMDRLADVAWQAMLWEGTHDKARRNGKPLELLTQYLSNFPMPMPTPRDLAVFLPEKRSRQYKGGSIVVEIAGETHEFLNPEIFPQIAAGTNLDFAFDPSEPTLGAAIYDQRGFLCWADYLPAGPVISARDRSADEGPQMLKRYKLAHRTAARLLDITTLRTVKIAESRTRGCVGNNAANQPPTQDPRPKTQDLSPNTSRLTPAVKPLSPQLAKRKALNDYAAEALANIND